MVKNPLWFLLVFFIYGSCSERPVFPDKPAIDLTDFYFREIQNISLDSLVITLQFQDGNGDMRPSRLIN